MDKAPERIWVQNDTENHKDELAKLGIKPVLEAISCFQEYTRTDISNALIAAAYEAAADSIENLPEKDRAGPPQDNIDRLLDAQKRSDAKTIRALTPDDARAAYDAAIRAAKIEGMREAAKVAEEWYSNLGKGTPHDAITALIEETEKGGN